MHTAIYNYRQYFFYQHSNQKYWFLIYLMFHSLL